MPGTMGSVLFTLIWWLLLQHIPPYTQSILWIISSLISYPMIKHTIQKLNIHDAKQIVIDEFIGMWLTLLCIPLFATLSSIPIKPQQMPYLVMTAFILFRFFDILKPIPINLIDEKIKNPWGVLLDDIVAGIFAGCCLLILLNYLY